MIGETAWEGFDIEERAAATLETPVTGVARAGRVAAASECNGPAVRRMQSNRDATSPPFMKSSRNWPKKNEREMNLIELKKKNHGLQTMLIFIRSH